MPIASSSLPGGMSFRCRSLCTVAALAIGVFGMMPQGIAATSTSHATPRVHTRGMAKKPIAGTPPVHAIQPASSTAQPAATGGKPPGKLSQNALARENVVVVGTRLGGGSAVDVKRRSLQDVSVLTQEDLERIPDTSVANVLRRVPGVQVQSLLGGQGTITIRGLSQTEERINGRNLTSTISRGFDLGAIPPAMITGVDVYKTPSASQIEGGIGGQIDMHTARPFDFSGFAGSTNASGGYMDVAGKPQVLWGGFLSDRWKTKIGEFGILAGGAYQNQTYATANVTVDGNVPLAFNGQTYDAPSDINKINTSQHHQLTTQYTSVQWRPNSHFLTTGDFIYNNQVSTTLGDTLYAALATPTSLQTYGNSNAVRSGTWSNVPLYSYTNQDQSNFATFHGALNTRYTNNHLTLFAEAAYTNTAYHDLSPNFLLASTAPTLTETTGGGKSGFNIAGIDPRALDNWVLGGPGTRREHDYGNEWAWRGDAIYTIDSPIRSVQFGGRYNRRGAGIRVGNPNLPNYTNTPTATPDLVGESHDYGGGSQSQWAAPRGAAFYNSPQIVSLYGPAYDTPAYQVANNFSGLEKSYQVYGEGLFGFKFAHIQWDGNFGLRYTDTDLSVNSSQTSGDGVYTPINSGQKYHAWLPSLNIRAEIAHGLYARFSYSKQLTRPVFWQLSPVLTLDPTSRTGNAGNPQLRPLRANQFDGTLEYYFGHGNMIYVAGFEKNVSGYIAYATRTELLNGGIYQVNRPYNLNTGWIAGSEVGYTQNFTFLPGAWSGLGVNASYTFVASSKSTNSSGYRVGLQNLAHDNYQVSGLYKWKGFGADIAWVWSSRIVEATSGDAFGRPLYRRPYGQLDANLSYALTKRINLTANATNLLAEKTSQYYLDQRYFGNWTQLGRSVYGGISIKFGRTR